MPESLAVYLHFPCFDGVISAVLACEYLERKRGFKAATVVPVNYSEREAWAGRDLHRPAAVVDFLYHPQADFWADHHQTTFLTPELEADYRQRDSADRLYNPQASSCAEVIWRKAYRRLREPRFKEMVQWARRIDSARYASVQEAVLGDSPALRINMSFLRNASADYCEFLVSSLRAGTLAAVAQSKQVEEPYHEARAALQSGQRLFREASRLEKDGIVVFDMADTGSAMLSRYAPYIDYPQARYSVGILNSSSGAKITAMRNPWRNFKSVPLGQIFSRYGGGGHQRVASVLLKDQAQARQTLIAILNDLRSANSAAKEGLHGD